MNQADLLARAAQAAGYVLDADHARLDVRDASGAPLLWNPLLDDGDALRLAVELDFLIEIDKLFSNTTIAGHRRGNGAQVAHDGDPARATRMAIVLAAAALARPTGSPAGGDRHEN